MSVKRISGTLLLLLSLLSVSKSYADAVSLQTKQSELNELVEQFNKHGLFSGVVTVQGKGDKISSAVGLAQRSSGKEIVHNSQFGVGSVSKTFTAALLLKLVGENKLSLNDELSSWFPDLRGTTKGKITLLQLLRHRSGFVPHFRFTCWRTDNCKELVSQGKLLPLILSTELAFKPGEDRLYGNTGYYLLARVIEKVTQKPYAEALLKEVLSPLGLTDTFSRNGEVLASEPTQSYVPAKHKGWQQSRELPAEIFLGGADIVSTATDLSQFQAAVFSEKLFSKSTLSLLVNETSATPWSRINGLDDWYVVDGQVNGDSAIVAHNPKDGSSVQILSNQGTSYWHKRLMMLVGMQIINGEGSSYVSDYASFSLQKAAIEGRLEKFIKVAQYKPEQLNSADVSAIIQQFDWADASEHAARIADLVYRTDPTDENFAQFQRICDNDRNRQFCYSLTNPAMSSYFWEDEQRQNWQETDNRPLYTQIFYPSAEAELDDMMLANGSFKAGKIAIGGEYWGSGKRPLILLSHGTGGSLIQHLWLIRELTKQGYIVAGVNHHGNTAVERKYQSPGFILWWERALDLNVLMSRLKQESEWAERIDFDKVAVAGFSLGGYTAMSVAGARTDKQLFYDFCDSELRDFTCEPQLEFEKMVEEFNQIAHKEVIQQSFKRQSNSFNIAELKGAFAIAPGLAQSMIPSSVNSINKPVNLVVGDLDTISPGKTNAEHLHNLLPDSKLSVVTGADHYSFLSECTDKGRQKLGKLCESSANRKQHHSIVARQAVEFFKSLF